MSAISSYPADLSTKWSAVVQTSTTERWATIDENFEYIVKHCGRATDATAAIDPVICGIGTTALTLTFAADDNKYALEDGEVVTIPAGQSVFRWGLVSGAATAPVLAIIRGKWIGGKT